MGINEKMQEQGGCPSGLVGRLGGFLMNNFHKNVFLFGLSYVNISEDDSVLDIGCGGGMMLKMLSKKAAKGRVCGIDHSEDMVVLANKINRKNAVVEVKQASVSDLPYGDEQFDVVTACETIQFWPDIENDLKEINRVLKPQGVLLILDPFTKGESSWTDFLQLKSKDDYINVLEKAGFKNINADTESKPKRICITAQK